MLVLLLHPYVQASSLTPSPSLPITGSHLCPIRPTSHRINKPAASQRHFIGIVLNSLHPVVQAW